MTHSFSTFQAISFLNSLHLLSHVTPLTILSETSITLQHPIRPDLKSNALVSQTYDTKKTTMTMTMLKWRTSSKSITVPLLIIIITFFILSVYLFTTSSDSKRSASNSILLVRQVSIPVTPLQSTSTHSTSITTNRRDGRKKDIKEEGLARARASIRTAMASNRRNRSLSFNHLSSFIYRNPGAFYQSYLEMERRLKVYVYDEGEIPIVHDGPCKDIYTIEGRFIQEMDHGSNKFRTNDPNQAHLYFMPFSVTRMVSYIYTPMSYNITPLKQFVSDYVNVISIKYPFWNTTQGADHFMLACHDWGPNASKGNQKLYKKSIRVLCNANSSEGFNPQKDVSLPEIHLYDGNISPKLLSFPRPTSIHSRPHLAFFAGGLHGPIRPILLKHWMGRDPNLQVHEYLPKDLDYYNLMLHSRFCLCPSGYEVASPRIVEAIYAECIPVILSKNYVLPFSDVLRWEAFSIQVNVDDIPRLKDILMSVSEEEYKKLIEGIRGVREHFVINKPAKRFDVFHMILHSVWLRRLNLKLR